MGNSVETGERSPVVGEIDAACLMRTKSAHVSPAVGKTGTETVSTTMVDIMGSEDGESGTGKKENFIGRVVRSEVDASDERFQTEYESDFDVFMQITPLTEYEEDQFVLGMDTSTAWGSRYLIMVGHLENIHGPLGENGITDGESLCDFLEGKVYEFRDLTFEEDEEFTWEHGGQDGHTEAIRDLFPDEEYRPDNMTVPVREVTDPEELADLGIEAGEEVTEPDF